jgi:uncharacterized protein (TIGR03437 family)
MICRRTFLPLLAPLLAAGAINQLPAHFEPQGNGFLARTGRGTYLLTDAGGLRFSTRAEMTFAGANLSSRAEPMRRLPGKTNYLRGSDPTKWRTGVPQFGGVRYASIYPGVDLIYHADPRLEYDLLISPRVSPRHILMEFRGAQSVRLDHDGGLIVRADDGELRLNRPRISQDRREVRGGFRLVGGRHVAFWIGAYDHNLPLLIDPVIGSFGTLSAEILGVATDAVGNVYIAGNTDYGAPPIVNALQPNLGSGNCSPEDVPEPCQDVFVAKLDPTATTIIYSTYLGDNGADWFGGLAVDAQGNAYLAASAYPAEYYDEQPTATGHAFVRKLSPDGSALLYDKSLGAATKAARIVVDASGNAYVTGTSFSASFSAVNAIQSQTVIIPIYVTKDGGATWSPIHAPASTVSMLAIPSGESSTLYAATSAGLLKSLDGGATWTNLIPTAIAAGVVVLDPKTPSTVYTVYADASNFGQLSNLARSVDAGATWNILNLPATQPFNTPPVIGALAVDPENSSALWIAAVGYPATVYESLDGGATWQLVNGSAHAGLFELFTPTGITVDPTNSAHVFACCANTSLANAVVFTQDGGATWTEGSPVSPYAHISPPVLDPANPSVLYAAYDTELFRSADGGISWTPMNLPPVPASINNVAIDASGAISLVSDAGYFLRSPDRGFGWTVTPGPWGLNSIVLAIDPAQPKTVYVGAPQYQIQDAFAAKLDGAGNTVWATLLGGSGVDSGESIAVDLEGNVYLAGTTSSADFPLVNPLQTTLGGGSSFRPDAFVAEISADGSRLVYSTYFGGGGGEASLSVSVDASGEAFVAGTTASASFPLVNPLFSAFGTTDTEDGTGAGFVSKIAAGGGSLLFSTFFPANPMAITFDAGGSVWLAGGSGGVQLPLVQSIQGTAGGGFLSRLNFSGSELEFSTFLCGEPLGIALRPGGSVWVGGSACFQDYPAIANFSSYDPGGYLARIDPAPPAAQPGVPRIDGVYNAAGFEWGNAVAPGEIVTLLGAELAASTATAPGAPLPVSLSDVSVSVGGIPAPLYYVSPGQINLQVPTSLPLGIADLAVTRGTNATHRSLGVFSFRPGIFFVNGVPAITHASDFSLVTASNPAHPGEYLAIFCSGLGATTPSGGEFISAGGSAEIYFQYAGLVPGSIGLYQINFQLPGPGYLATGLTDLLLSIGYITLNVPFYVD